MSTARNMGIGLSVLILQEMIKPKRCIKGNNFAEVRLHNKRVTVVKTAIGFQTVVENFNPERKGKACTYFSPRSGLHVDVHHNSAETLEAIFWCVKEMLGY